jgi:CRISPR-associated endonuclease Cas2
MVILVTYDIGDTRERLLVQRLCKDCGLHRVQRSVFRGVISARARDMLLTGLAKMCRHPRQDTWDVQVYFISQDDFANHLRFTSQGKTADSEDQPEIKVL